jgi:hypothetical protein
VVDRDCAATRSVSGIDIPPTVANEEALFQIDAVAFRGSQNQARPRLPAIAAVPVVVIANETIGNRQAAAQVIIYRFYRLAILTAPSNVGLVGNQNEEIIGQMKLRKHPFGVGSEFYPVDAFGWMRFTIPDRRPDDNPVTV